MVALTCVLRERLNRVLVFIFVFVDGLTGPLGYHFEFVRRTLMKQQARYMHQH
ncbi:uncharacterized protein LAESUDRAFT_720061 [Laetiporus sulphureus 93-53]|uniref:Uncharacterized protein n=1 Tax=Laetiporus sulphureus 93-53 TaxID=1314785 RepID=A0A165HRA7_9APHY|nr:uncharacterized protein LAESUDRAFT_720061 [Laetiporus sulphureus 93-53]KZT12077.1 hypothetical protein LAESUDRAFT_720061 [Laetiporus sulphureus 93-53]